MSSVTLVMPMAGRGSRFQKFGFEKPKPLIDLFGKPFFVWAVESATASLPIGEMIFVVLSEHIHDYRIDEEICARYPHARIITLDDVTTGSAETAMYGLEHAPKNTPVAINDCDHAFAAPGLSAQAALLGHSFAGGLVGFSSDCPAYSYVRFNEQCKVAGTIEKQAISDAAIAGCYLVESPQTFMQFYETYRANCPYAELFTSGIYNEMSHANNNVFFYRLQQHLSFGTPEEMARLQKEDFITL